MFVLENPFMQNMKSLEKHWLCLQSISIIQGIEKKQREDKKKNWNRYTRGYQKVLSLTWKEPEIWIYSALFFNVVPFQLHTLLPSSFPVINTRSVEVNILVP